MLRIKWFLLVSLLVASYESSAWQLWNRVGFDASQRSAIATGQLRIFDGEPWRNLHLEVTLLEEYTRVDEGSITAYDIGPSTTTLFAIDNTITQGCLYCSDVDMEIWHPLEISGNRICRIAGKPACRPGSGQMCP